VDKLIREFYLSRQKPTVTALYRTIALECFEAGVAAPSYKAARTRVRALAARDTLRAREGAKAAGDRFRPIRASLSASEPLELVQIDHTVVDVIVVDDLHRKPVGRPRLPLAIDVATRNVLGFFLSLKAPSATAVALTISRAVLRKTTYLAGLQVDAEWPACGIPRSLHLDNAKEFRGRALRWGCEQHGIQIIYRPPMLVAKATGGVGWLRLAAWLSCFVFSRRPAGLYMSLGDQFPRRSNLTAYYLLIVTNVQRRLY
jgi:putative transposase